MLSDPNRRQVYDVYGSTGLAAGGRGGGGAPPGARALRHGGRHTTPFDFHGLGPPPLLLLLLPLALPSVLQHSALCTCLPVIRWQPAATRPRYPTPSPASPPPAPQASRWPRKGAQKSSHNAV